MTIFEVHADKKRYLDLLLLADEQESMIDRYLERGTLFVLEEDGQTLAVCVVTEEGKGVAEIKNLAVRKQVQRKGLGRRMIEHVETQWRGKADSLLVGTGDSLLTLPFYEACGFVRSHVVPNFFTEQYDHPIFECGKQLVDMVYLKKPL